MKLFTKILLLTFFLSLVPAVVLTSVFLKKSSEAMQEQLISAGNVAINGVSDQFSDFFVNRQKIVETLSHTETLKTMDWQKIDPYLKSEEQILDGMFEKFILGRPDSTFHNTKGGNPNVGGLRTFNDKDPDAKPKSIIKRGYWQATIRTAKAQSHISEPMVSYTTGVRQVVIASSVVDESNEIVGMLGGAVSWKEIESELDHIKSELARQFDYNPRICLISSEGTYIYHWDKDKALSYVHNLDGTLRLNEIGEPEVLKFNLFDERSSALTKAWDALNKAEEGYVVYEGEEGRLVFWYMPVEGTDYYIGLEIPFENVFAMVAEQKKFVISLLLISLILVFNFSFFFAKALTKRLTKLNEAAKQFDGSRLIFESDETKDEIGELARSFSKMAEETVENLSLVRSQGEELRMHKDNLEVQVDARTKELKEALLEAEKANKLKGDFVANVSHEIRTPMNVIMGFLEELKHTDLDGDQRDYLEHVESSTAILMTLINDLLDFSKLEDGKVDLEKAPFILSELVEEVQVMFQPKAESKGLAYKSVVSNDCFDTYLGDTIRLKQILLNYLSNAFKFTERGSIELSVSVMSSSDYEDELLLEVRDTGVGVSAEAKKRLFQRFEQEDSSSTRVYGGTGLGLSIVQKLAELMGGEVGVNDNSPEGAVFWASFKLQKDFSNHKKTASIKCDFDGVVKFLQEQSFKILAIDDNKMNLKLAKMIFVKLGFDVTLASSAQEGLDLLMENEYDIIFMDCMMPDMDGYQATEAIRRLEDLGTLKKKNLIIALTANVMAADIKRCMNCGMDAHIGKPIDRNEIVITVAEFLMDDASF